MQKSMRHQVKKINSKKINIKEINNRNFIYQTHIRFMHTNGFLPNMFIRIFALVMAAVMVLCAINMYTAYKAYEKMQMQMIWLPIRRKTIHQHMYIIIMKILMNIRKRCKRERKCIQVCSIRV